MRAALRSFPLKARIRFCSWRMKAWVFSGATTYCVGNHFTCIDEMSFSVEHPHDSDEFRASASTASLLALKSGLRAINRCSSNCVGAIVAL